MKSNTAYMNYYEHIAKLDAVANKQTIFWMHILHHSRWDEGLKQLVASLTVRDKRQIMEIVSPDSKDPLNLARQYISRLCKAELMVHIGEGAYLLNPSCVSGVHYIKKAVRERNGVIFQSYVFKEKGKVITKTEFVEDDTGEG